jgi:O-antigen/teichoic acid export membrane protein
MAQVGSRRSLKLNIVANVIGRFYAAIAGVLFVPVYLHFLGVESYGLFALLNSYMAIAGLLDLGFSGALMRELAKLSAVSPEKMRDLVWTISLPYCGITLLAGLAIFIGSPWIASVAIGKGSSLADPVIVRAVGLAGFGLTLQLPVYLYTGGLAGLERQDVANTINVASTTLRHGVAVTLLWGVSNSVVTLMAWQAAIAALTAIALFCALWVQMPSHDRRPRFRLGLLRETWKFAAGLGGSAIFGTIMTQSDKVIIGALLPLTEVGHYMVASVVATNILLVAQPVVAAAVPRFSQLVAMKDWMTTQAIFEKLSQLVALMVIPISTTVAVFPQQTLMLWTGNSAIAENAEPLLRYLAIGIGFGAFGCIPYGLMMATGRTWTLFIFSVTACAITLPLVYLATTQFGSAGTAEAICVYQCMAFAAFAIVLLALMPWDDWLRWISTDVILPQAVVAAVGLMALAIAPHAESRVELLALLSVTWFVSAIMAGLAMPWMRQQALSHWRQIRALSFGPMS